MNSHLPDKVFLFLLGSVFCFLAFGHPTRDSFSASEAEKKKNVQLSPQKQTPQPGKKPGNTPTKEVKNGKNNKKEETQSATDPSSTKALNDSRFTTRDGVKLEGSYYPGRDDKTTVPVVLLHGHRKSSQEFEPLIAELKKRGYAIVTFDFRGHGKSTKRIPAIEVKEKVEDDAEPMAPVSRKVVGNKVASSPAGQRRHARQAAQQQHESQFETHIERGDPVDYKESDFKPDDYKRLFNYDCEPFQRMLIALNNEGKLNLHKLVIVGFDMGGSVGAKWAEQTPKHVKSLIVLEPNHDEASLMFFRNSRIFQKEVPVLFIVGKLNAEAKLNAERLRDDLLGKEKEKNDDPRSLSSVAPILDLPTDRRGSDLFSDSQLAVPQKIVEFIEMKLESAKEKDTKWRKI